MPLNPNLLILLFLVGWAILNKQGLIRYLFTDPAAFVLITVALILSLTFHEFAHAYTAYKLGDRTPKEMDRVSLNPLKHLDPVGTLLLLIAGFGFAKPVPINPYRLGRWGTFWTTAAGPLSNVLIALVVGGIMAAVGPAAMISSQDLTTLGRILLTVFGLNIVLAAFNMVPVPPLDGSRILGALFPPLRRLFDQFEANPMSFMISMFLIFFVLKEPIGVMLAAVQRWAIGLVF